VLTAQTRDVDLMSVWFDSDPDSARVNVIFPINKAAGSEDTAVVYFELEPGSHLPIHTDSAEEILYIVAGEAEAQVGEERGRVAAGDLAVVPSMVPHGLTNVGDKTVKVVGFFCAPEIISTFDEAIQPLGTNVVTQGAPAPAPA
jgi:quercetin dioxygenase-like cupin family protein